MPEKHYIPQYHDSKFLHDRKVINLNSYRQYHRVLVQKELLQELSREEITKNHAQSQYKAVCFIIGLLALLSIGICVQADSITQALREMVRISAQQTIRINN
jgi:hypothetical protein